MKRILALSLALLLAGCMGADSPKGPEDAQQPPAPSTSTTGTAPPNLPSEPATNNASVGPPTLQLNGCSGWDAFWDFLPSSQVPTTNTPPGWERTDPAPTTGTGVLVLRCEKIGVGPIERGPVTMMIDRHWNVDVPATCKQDAAAGTTFGVLAKLYVDDQEVADYLRQAFGMPTGLLTMDFAESAAGPIIQHDVRWTADGGAESHLTLVQDSTSVNHAQAYRTYWTVGERLVRWQLDLKLDGPDYANRPGRGTVAAPMLMAQVSETFVGVADWFPSITGPSSVQFYEDYRCEAPST